MGKELFGAETLSTALDDNDRVAFGQPDAVGSKNVVWSVFLSLVASSIDFTSSILNLTTTSSETPSGNPTTQQAANIEFTGLIEALESAVSNLASAAAYIQADSVPIDVTTTEAQLTIENTADESDTDIIEVDETLDIIYLKEAGTYTFLSVSRVTNTANNTDHTVYVRVYDYSDDSLLNEREITAIKKTTTSTTKLVTVTITEATTIYIALVSTSDTAITLEDFTSNIAVNSATGGGISHADADNFLYGSRNGAWYNPSEQSDITVTSSTTQIAIDMRNALDYVITLDNTVVSVPAIGVTWSNGYSQHKEVVISNNSGSAQEVDFSAGTYENGLTAAYSVPTGKTRIYYKNIGGVLYAGLVDYDKALDLSNYSSINRAALSIDTSVIDIDYDSKNQFLCNNSTILAVSTSVSITHSNDENAEAGMYWLNITNADEDSSTGTLITFPAGTLNGSFEVDSERWDSTNKIFNPLADGKYLITEEKIAGVYYVQISDVQV